MAPQAPALARLARGGLASWASAAVGAAVTIVVVRWGLRLLGPERYGAWLAMYAVLSYPGLADLGLGNAIVNAVASHAARQEEAALRRVIATSAFALAAVGAAFAVVGGALAVSVDAARLLGVRPSAAAELRASILVALALFAARLPLGVHASVLIGLQRLHRVRLWQATGHVLQLGLVAIVVWSGGGLVAFAAAVMSAQLAASALIALEVRVTVPWARLRAAAVSAPVFRALVTPGRDFFILQMVALAVLCTPNLVVALFVGAEAVPTFAIPFQVAFLPATLIALFAGASWPVIADLHARGDREGVVRAFSTTLRVGTSLAAGSFLVVLVFGRDLAGVWAGPGVAIDAPVLWIAGAYAFLFVVESGAGNVLNGTGRTKFAMRAAVPGAFLTLALYVTLARAVGVAGVALAMLLGALATTGWAIPWGGARALDVRLHDVLAGAMRGWLAPLGAAAGAALVARAFTAPGWARVGAAAAITMLYLGLLYAAMLTRADRAGIMDALLPRTRR